jgi:hypothetical protein
VPVVDFRPDDALTVPGMTQQETATAAGTITTPGDLAVTVTAAGLAGSPVTLAVAVADNDAPETWAAKVRAALQLAAAVTARYEVSGAGTDIVLTRLVAASQDATLNIALENDTCEGADEAPESVCTRQGMAPGSGNGFPFVRVGEWQAINRRAYGVQLWEVIWRPHVFSTFDGQEQAQSLMHSLVQALTSTSAPVTATGWTVKGPSVEDLTAEEETEDELTYWHGMPVFRFYVSK